jgi:Tol biopolymer transport system component
MPLRIPRLVVLAVGVSVLAMDGGASGQGQAAGVARLGGIGPVAFAHLAIDMRRSPSGLIVFSAGSHPHEDIYVVNADGSGLVRLTDDPGADFDPTWSPDGRGIAYRHESGGGDDSAEIYVMNADGSQKRNLTRRPGQDHAPAWSPDGRRIAFASVRGGPIPSIWVMNTDGSNQKRVSRVDGEYPAWSPNGRKIAFERNTFGPTGWDIWVMNSDGSGGKPLVAWRTDEKGAAWSPDGKHIAFGSDRGTARGFDHVWIAKADGSHKHRLTSQFGERPAWSPDGAYLVFTAGRLAIVRRGGSGATAIRVSVPGEPALADWTRR